jgi:hypothetical protein
MCSRGRRRDRSQRTGRRGRTRPPPRGRAGRGTAGSSGSPPGPHLRRAHRTEAPCGPPRGAARSDQAPGG